jgi:hypothetical protein
MSNSRARLECFMNDLNAYKYQAHTVLAKRFGIKCVKICYNYRGKRFHLVVMNFIFYLKRIKQGGCLIRYVWNRGDGKEPYASVTLLRNHLYQASNPSPVLQDISNMVNSGFIFNESDLIFSREQST